MGENRTKIWPAVIFMAVIIIIICCAIAPNTTVLIIVLLVLGALTALVLLFKWGAVTGTNASGDPAAVNKLRIKRAVIIAVITIMAVYTAVLTAQTKAGNYSTSLSWLPVDIAIIALPAYGLYSLISGRVKKKKEAEARQLEELMDTPLEKFSDKQSKAEKLANNYDNDPGNDVTP